MFSDQLLTIIFKSYFFTFEIMRFTFAKTDFIIKPIIQNKLLLIENKTIVIVFNQEGRVYLIAHYLWNFFIMELQKVWE